MNIHNGLKYESNYARAAAYFLGTRGKRPTEPKRQAAFDFITGFYKLLFTNPKNVGLHPSDDVWFAPWEQQRER